MQNPLFLIVIVSTSQLKTPSVLPFENIGQFFLSVSHLFKLIMIKIYMNANIMTTKILHFEILLNFINFYTYFVKTEVKFF